MISTSSVALMLIATLSVLAAVTVAQTAPSAVSRLKVESLRCEFGLDPMGIDVPRPRLSWQVQSDKRGDRQTAYQVLVASSPEKLAADVGDLWDSGRVASDQTAFVEYDGAPMTSSQQLHWKVRAWDRDGVATEWSKPATWTMGRAWPQDWAASWIIAPGVTESLLLRKEFAVKPGLRRALVHVTGMGQYELRFNGQNSSDDLLSPGWTNYRRTILYDTRDVTKLLKSGPNAVGMILGNGMYNVVRRDRFAKFTGTFGPLRAILHLQLEYQDGSIQTIGTDESWRVNPGPIIYNSIYGGEDFDARLDPVGWDQPGFDDRAWPHAVRPVRPEGVLRGYSAATEPIRAIETRPALSAKTLPNGNVVYDFGQNASFMPRIRVTGPAGSSIKLTPAEIVGADGSIQRMTMGSAERGSSWWKYIKGTDAEETWFPRFYYVGSRYVQAECIPAVPDGAKPQIESIEMVVVHASCDPAGEFETSDAMLNKIRDMIRWAQRSNMVSILTDCPHREKLGWLEQTHLNGPSLRYEWDLARSFAKTVRDIGEAQDRSGFVPNIAPEYVEFSGQFRTAAEWGASFIALPWQQYLFVGDRGPLESHYDGMKRYFAYLRGRAVDYIIAHGEDALGDWYDYGPRAVKEPELTPPPNTATAFYFQDASLLAQMARLLGKSDDAQHYADEADRIRRAYNAAFYDEASGSYQPSSQAANAIPLVMGIVDPDQRERVQQALIRCVEANEYAIDSGGIGTRYVIQGLAEAGRSDLIYRILHNVDKPGYAYLVKRGETTMTEAWDGRRGASHNHFMLGQVTEWFYKDLAGIGQDSDSAGFHRIVLKPTPVGDLAWVRASYNSIAGRIAVRWERRNGAFSLQFTLPANTTGTVYLPASEGSAILESGQPVEQAHGLRMLRRVGNCAVFAAESGTYDLVAR